MACLDAHKNDDKGQNSAEKYDEVGFCVHMSSVLPLMKQRGPY